MILPPKDIDLTIRIEQVAGGYIVTFNGQREVHKTANEVALGLVQRFEFALKRQEVAQKRYEELASRTTRDMGVGE